MTVRAFATRFRVRVTRDACGDEVCAGRRAHLYVDAGAVCLMGLDVPRRGASAELLHRLNAAYTWEGDATGGKRDVWVKEIPEAGWRLAVRIAGCKAKRNVSPETRARLRAGGFQPHAGAHAPAAERDAPPWDV